MNISETEAAHDTITASYKWTRDEFVTSQLSYVRQKMGREKNFIYWLTALIWVFVIGLRIMGEWSTTVLLEAVVLSILAMGRDRVTGWFFKLKWKRTQHRESDITFRFAPTAIEMQTSFGNSSVTWNAFIKIVEAERGFLLFQQARLYHWLPLHAFESPADVEQMRDLIIQSEVPFKAIKPA